MLAASIANLGGILSEPVAFFRLKILWSCVLVLTFSKSKFSEFLKVFFILTLLR